LFIWLWYGAVIFVYDLFLVIEVEKGGRDWMTSSCINRAFGRTFFFLTVTLSQFFR